jgi:hypothetical protein
LSVSTLTSTALSAGTSAGVRTSVVESKMTSGGF